MSKLYILKTLAEIAEDSCFANVILICRELNNIILRSQITQWNLSSIDIVAKEHLHKKEFLEKNNIDEDTVVRVLHQIKNYL